MAKRKKLSGNKSPLHAGRRFIFDIHDEDFDFEDLATIASFEVRKIGEEKGAFQK